ncbi:MAG: hypothetical protein K0S56_1725 [Microvirga sp.]|jgi:hypothetical protein|nr:hypothetical protein [Microvirga sp.]
MREEVKLLSERWLTIAGIFRLLFAHHVNHLDTIKDNASAGNGLEPEHCPYPPLDGTMILLDAIVQVGALADSDRLQLPPRSVLQPVCRITGDGVTPCPTCRCPGALR